MTARILMTGSREWTNVQFAGEGAACPLFSFTTPTGAFIS